MTTTATARQSEILAWIAAYLAENGYGPTRREVSRAFGFRSPVAAQCHLLALRKKGLVTWVDGQPRTVRLTEGTT